MKEIMIITASIIVLFTMNGCNRMKNTHESEEKTLDKVALDTAYKCSLAENNVDINYIGCTMRYDEPCISIDRMPQFVGGDTALIKFVKENLKYPEEDTQGRVVIRFVVDSIGDIQNPTVVRSLSEITDKEALRVIKAMPRWIPGEERGKPISIYYTLPVRFQKQTN